MNTTEAKYQMLRDQINGKRRLHLSKQWVEPTWADISPDNADIGGAVAAAARGRKIPISIRIDLEDLKQIRKFAARHGAKYQWLICEIIHRAVQKFGEKP